MLAANAELDASPCRPAAIGGDADHLADALRVERDERVLLDDAELLVLADKARGVVARDAEHGLSQIVGAKAEERGGLGYVGRKQGGARQFDHCADLIGEFDPGL